METQEPRLRRALPEDASQIVELYQKVYDGKYSDPMMSNSFMLRLALNQPTWFWMVAEFESQIVGSVVYRYDNQNQLAKVFAAVVDSKFRGHNLTEKLMTFGFDELKKLSPPVEVVYATTRTVSPAPQKLTANLGYKKLGIFPNVHQTDSYETHCLTALFEPLALQRRFTDFVQHPHVLPLFQIAAHECGLDVMTTVNRVALQQKIRTQNSAAPTDLYLEPIHATEFVRHRFTEKREKGCEHHWFFPFQEPNLVLSTPDQSVEVFCFLSTTDKHCVLIGIRDQRSLGYTRILQKATRLLHNLGARYLEFIMRADEMENIESVIQAEYIPSAYFPAMHQVQSQRYDFVVFSRSFEILNFRNIALEGVNQMYVAQYFNLWKELSLPELQIG